MNFWKNTLKQFFIIKLGQQNFPSESRKKKLCWLQDDFRAVQSGQFLQKNLEFFKANYEKQGIQRKAKGKKKHYFISDADTAIWLA
jgi:hypothetical protein